MILMKFVSILLLSVNLVYANVQQDIVFKSVLNQKTSTSFIKRLRTFLINNNFGDPYNQTFDQPIVIDFKKILEELPEDTRSWIGEFQNLLRLKLFESSYKLKIINFSYSLEQFSTDLNPVSASNGRQEYVTLNSVQGLKLAASSIIFEVALQKTTSGEPISFFIELKRPEFLISSDLPIDLPMGWQTDLLAETLLITLKSVNLSKVFANVIEKPHLINFRVDDIEMPLVSVRVGKREVTFDRDKIKAFLDASKEQMKMAILDILRARMQERFSNIIKDNPQEFDIPKSYVMRGSIDAGFEVRSINPNKEKHLLEAKFDGFFCSKETLLDGCLPLPETKLRRVIDDETFASSMEDMDHQFVQKRASIALSISEHYFNELITAVIQANLLDLGSDDFRLGTERAFVLAEEKGEGFNLYLDIIHKLKGAQRVLVGRSELRFPIRFKIGLKIILVDKHPRLQIRVLEVNTSDKMLLEGVPEYGLKTNVDSVRFKKRVLKNIHEDIAPFNQKMLVDLELEEFKGTYLEELDFFSDGKGRGIAVLLMNGFKNREITFY